MNTPGDYQLTHDDHVPAGVTYAFSLLVHDLESAANLGSLFRLADAFALERIYLTGSTPTPPDKTITRASRNTVKVVPHVIAEDPLAVIDMLKSDGYTIIGLELSIASIDIRQLQLKATQKICLVTGAENAGVSKTLLDQCDISVHIPMLGQNSSMNVAMATALAAQDICRQLQALPKQAPA